MALCWSCNPLCGKCTPPSMKSVTCPECDMINVVNIQLTNTPEPIACRKCGADITMLSIPEAKYCKRYNIECGNPCYQSEQDAPVDAPQMTCPTRTDPIQLR